MNAIVTTIERGAPANRQIDLSPQTFEQALTFSQYLADSDMVPKDFKGKPGNCLIGMQWGAELGLKPLQALQNIAIINGRPSLWGDAMLGLVRASPLCEYVTEGWEADGTAYCKAKRRGEPEQVRTFSDADAKLAGLLGKAGPWTTGPKRMKQLRARAFALRDVFTDILRGMAMAEEAMDSGEIVQHPASPPASPVVTAPIWPDDKFEAQFARWSKAVAEGLKTPDDILALARSKGELTPAQNARILALRSPLAEEVDEPDPFVAAMDAAEQQGSAE